MSIVPVLDFRCGLWRRVFNALTDTALHGVKRRPVDPALIFHGFAQGVSTAQLARELECDRSELLHLRHRLQDLAFWNRNRMPLDDTVLEADGAYQNAGEKRRSSLPEDPPRHRANKRRGQCTWDNDRPQICGVLGRESGQLRLTVAEHSDGATLEQITMRATWPTVTVNTDEWQGYNGLPAMGRARPTVCHLAKEWAWDDDRNSVCEVHINTLEGMRTGLRNFLRKLRGVSKK